MSFYDPQPAYDGRFDAFNRGRAAKTRTGNTTSVYLRPTGTTTTTITSSNNNYRNNNNNYSNVQSKYLNHFPKSAVAKITTTSTSTRTTSISKPSASGNTPIVRSETFTKVDKPVARSDTFTVKNPDLESKKVRKVVMMNANADNNNDYRTFTKKKADPSATSSTSMMNSNRRSYSVSPEKYISGIDTGTYRKQAKVPVVTVIDYGTYRKTDPRYAQDSGRDSYSRDSSPEKETKNGSYQKMEKKEKHSFFGKRQKSPSKWDSSTDKSEQSSYQNLNSSDSDKKTRNFLSIKPKGKRDLSPVKRDKSPTKVAVDTSTYRKIKPSLYSRFSSPKLADGDDDDSPERKKKSYSFFSSKRDTSPKKEKESVTNTLTKRDRSPLKERADSSSYQKLEEKTPSKKSHTSLFSRTKKDKSNHSKLENEERFSHSLPAKTENGSNGRIDNLIKRFEKNLQSDEEPEAPPVVDRRSKPPSSISLEALRNAFENKGAPKYRDIGIDCKMDDVEKDELRVPTTERKTIRSLSPFKFFARMRKSETPDMESLVSIAPSESPQRKHWNRDSAESSPMTSLQDSPTKARKQWFDERPQKPIAITNPYNHHYNSVPSSAPKYDSYSIERNQNCQSMKPIRVEFYRPKHKEPDEDTPVDREKFRNFRDSFRKYNKRQRDADDPTEKEDFRMDVDDPVLSKQTFFVAF